MGCAAPSHIHSIHSLFLLQKIIVRIMTLPPYLAHTVLIFNPLVLLPVEKIFTNRVSIVMSKFSCNMYPIQYPYYIKQDVREAYAYFFP